MGNLVHTHTKCPKHGALDGKPDRCPTCNQWTIIHYTRR